MNIKAMAKSRLNAFRNRRDIRAVLLRSDVPAEIRAPLRQALQTVPTGSGVIEKRRWELLNNFDRIVVVDFGAGTPSAERSHAEQAAGTTTELSIADAATASKPATWSRFLYFLTRSVGPARVLEMGTCVGISGSYIGSALRHNGGGTLVTMEGNPATADIARQTFAQQELSELVSVTVGPFQTTLPSVLDVANSFDMVFVDGHHDGDATLEYFEQIRPHLSAGAVVVFDDIRWSPGMTSAWQRIAVTPNLAYSVDMGDMGLVKV